MLNKYKILIKDKRIRPFYLYSGECQTEIQFQNMVWDLGYHLTGYIKLA